MAEPRALRRGKAFQKHVQTDFIHNSQDGMPQSEATISFAHRQKSRAKSWQKHRAKSGRADILITELGNFVTILEIKATNWDRIVPGNVTKNLWSHQHQLFRYVDKFVQVDGFDVCLGIVYPRPPRKAGLAPKRVIRPMAAVRYASLVKLSVGNGRGHDEVAKAILCNCGFQHP